MRLYLSIQYLTEPSTPLTFFFMWSYIFFIMVATQNIDTVSPIWTFSFRGVLSFVAIGLDINGCVILRGQQMYTVIQAVHSLLYIVTKCHFFSVVT